MIPGRTAARRKQSACDQLIVENTQGSHFVVESIAKRLPCCAIPSRNSINRVPGKCEIAPGDQITVPIGEGPKRAINPALDRPPDASVPAGNAANRRPAGNREVAGHHQLSVEYCTSVCVFV